MEEDMFVSLYLKVVNYVLKLNSKTQISCRYLTGGVILLWGGVIFIHPISNIHVHKRSWLLHIGRVHHSYRRRIPTRRPQDCQHPVKLSHIISIRRSIQYRRRIHRRQWNLSHLCRTS